MGSTALPGRYLQMLQTCSICRDHRGPAQAAPATSCVWRVPSPRAPAELWDISKAQLLRQSIPDPERGWDQQRVGLSPSSARNKVTIIRIKLLLQPGPRAGSTALSLLWFYHKKKKEVGVTAEGLVLPEC